MPGSTQRYLRERLDAVVSGTRFGKFVSVGAVGGTFDLTTLLTLTEVFDVSAAVANVLSIEVAILVMFAINDSWTFADEGNAGRRPLTNRLLRSHLVRAGGSTLQYVLFVLVFYNVSVELSLWGIDLWLVLVKGWAIGCAMLVNYVFESLYTWRVHDE